VDTRQTELSETKLLNATMLKKLGVCVALMFCFGYAMVPLYEKFCQVTGIRNLLRPDKEAVVNTQVDKSRLVTVEFDSNVSKQFWRFKPEFTQLKVHPGEIAQVVYEITNEQARKTAGQAVPSYGPKQAAEFFKKIECFCFERKTLDAGESRKMPVVFVVDPKLPSHINTITLSYTFFEVEGALNVAATNAATGAATNPATNAVSKIREN
jgi:cytochrome c oxidase assembly protein subunit 11